MENGILGKRSLILEPSTNQWESHAVCNPTVIQVDGTHHIFYRAIQHPNYSTVGHGIIAPSGEILRDDEPIMVPQTPEEREGVEDPRIACVEGVYYMLYTAWDGSSARVGAAKSTDLKQFTRIGIVSPNIPIAETLPLEKNPLYRYKGLQQLAHWGAHVAIWDKDAVLFPEKINGKFVMLHRFNPCIQIVYFDDFSQLQDNEFWVEYIKNIDQYTIAMPEQWWEAQKIGAGSTPIKTPQGWLLFYHGLDLEKVYRAGAMLLDLNDPSKVIGRLREPLFEGKNDWEINGIVNHVVFPQGVAEFPEVYKVYYGCADKRIGVIDVYKKALFKHLRE